MAGSQTDRDKQEGRQTKTEFRMQLRQVPSGFVDTCVYMYIRTYKLLRTDRQTIACLV